jgi:ribonuclease HI
MRDVAAWTPPGKGWAKINTDAGFCQNTAMAGIGVVARDSQGKVLFSAWSFMDNVGSAEEAEALACWEGLRLAKEWIRQPVVVESDCLGLSGR